MAVTDAARQGPVELYRYGVLAWFWRVLLLFGGALGALAAFGAVRGPEPWLWVGAAALLLPVWFFGTVVATRVVRDGDALRVATLLGWPRRVRVDRLGAPRHRRFAYSDAVRVHAPRMWQPVRGTLPVYLDLLASIPDRPAFERVFGTIPR